MERRLSEFKVTTIKLERFTNLVREHKLTSEVMAKDLLFWPFSWTVRVSNSQWATTLQFGKGV